MVFGKADTARSSSIWDRCFHHTAPEEPFDIFEAHRAMREHKGCLREECARKQAAWDVLVAAHRIVPDTGRTR